MFSNEDRYNMAVTPQDNSDNSMTTSDHTFHIPVMGTGFTVDTPLKVARFGISSVMSIGDDMLLDANARFLFSQ